MKKSKENPIEVLIDKQFEIAGYNLDEVNYKLLMENNEEEKKSKNPWYIRYTITEEKNKEFKEFFFKYMRRKVNKERIEKEYGWFHLMYGLNIIDA